MVNFFLLSFIIIFAFNGIRFHAPANFKFMYSAFLTQKEPYKISGIWTTAGFICDFLFTTLFYSIALCYDFFLPLNNYLWECVLNWIRIGTEIGK